jgi:Ca2+-binding EF-hand superfamily protein
MAATVSIKKFMTEEKLWMLFKHFDLDDKNNISKENIEEAMSQLGKKISQTELDETLSIHDSRKFGKISFDDFKKMFIEEIEENSSYSSDEFDDMFNDN